VTGEALKALFPPKLNIPVGWAGSAGWPPDVPLTKGLFAAKELVC
jgi:hypothetical protein